MCAVGGWTWCFLLGGWTWWQENMETFFVKKITKPLKSPVSVLINLGHSNLKDVLYPLLAAIMIRIFHICHGSPINSGKKLPKNSLNLGYPPYCFCCGGWSTDQKENQLSNVRNPYDIEWNPGLIHDGILISWLYEMPITIAYVSLGSVSSIYSHIPKGHFIFQPLIFKGLTCYY